MRSDSRKRARAQFLCPWVEQADCLLDLHYMHEPDAPLLLTEVLPCNIALAQRLGAPQYVIVDAGHKEGVLMRDFGRFGQADQDQACALLIECGFHGDPASRDVGCDMVARLLLDAGTLHADDIPAGWLLPEPAEQRVLEVTDAVVAPSMNVCFSQKWHGLETLEKAGSVIGWADDKPVVTPYNMRTLIMPSLCQLKLGVTVVHLARDYRAASKA